jgi:subtilisin family serine protease
LDVDETPEKVAPWGDWTPVTLHVSNGGEYPVRFTVSGLDDEKNALYSKLITRAAHDQFKIVKPPNGTLAAYLVEGGLLRVVYDELIVQFRSDVEWAERNEILEKAGFRTVGRNYFAENQWIVRHNRAAVAGRLLLEAADKFAEFEEVEFAWPNSVAEYQRWSDPIPEERRWWLDKLRVNVPAGKRFLDEGKSSVVIAVLDDGVDIEHPNLVSRVVPGVGRDFNFAASAPDYSNPRPKINTHSGEIDDYHGTPCAGLICSDGNENGYLGVAPGCKFVAVRIFNGVGLISEPAVANAIIYATGFAHVISCSWGGPPYPAVITAINGTSAGRKGKGTVFVCSAGNHGKSTVDFPASHSRAIAVGACGPKDEVTWYSHWGDKLDFVAPSSLFGTTVYSTDVSQDNWGFNTGSRVDPDGLFATDVGKTSAAAAMVAGVAALCLSANSNLTAAAIRALLRKTAAKVVGNNNPPVVYTPSGPNGRSVKFGSGCIDAAAAVGDADGP